jgi:5-formyltetrahydrofolate cyclo-ligase
MEPLPLAAKPALRQSLKAARATLPAAMREQGSAAIMERLFALPEVATAQRFFVYISHGPEVDTHALLHRLLREGRECVVPRITAARRMEAVPFRSFADLGPGPLGILTPVGGMDYTGAVEVAVTPGLGFTTQGGRIGFGAGYYDRWFASHTVGLKVAVAFSVQVVAALPMEPTDIPMDVLLTEEGAWRCRSYG